MSVRAVSCYRVSVAVRSLLEFERSVYIALLLVSPTTYPLQQSYFCLFGFPIRKDLFVLVCIITHNQIFDFKYCFVLGVLFERSEFLIATSKKKKMCVCACVCVFD